MLRSLNQELIQNADDAEATKVKFIIDSTQHSQNAESLIHPNLTRFQGPALYAWNNAIFKDEDWKNFGKIEDSIKQRSSLHIGKFGLGFLSVFHLTGKTSFHPMYVSIQYKCIYYRDVRASYVCTDNHLVLPIRHAHPPALCYHLS